MKLPLNTGSVRPTQGRTALVAQVNGGSQSFNAVNTLRQLARWMRMPCCTNQSSVAKAWKVRQWWRSSLSKIFCYWLSNQETIRRNLMMTVGWRILLFVNELLIVQKSLPSLPSRWPPSPTILWIDTASVKRRRRKEDYCRKPRRKRIRLSRSLERVEGQWYLFIALELSS